MLCAWILRRRPLARFHVPQIQSVAEVPSSCGSSLCMLALTAEPRTTIYTYRNIYMEAVDVYSRMKMHFRKTLREVWDEVYKSGTRANNLKLCIYVAWIYTWIFISIYVYVCVGRYMFMFMDVYCISTCTVVNLCVNAYLQKPAVIVINPSFLASFHKVCLT